MMQNIEAMREKTDLVTEMLTTYVNDSFYKNQFINLVSVRIQFIKLDTRRILIVDTFSRYYQKSDYYRRAFWPARRVQLSTLMGGIA